VISLGLLFPFFYIWVYLTWQDPKNWDENGGIAFYKTWMLDVLINFAPAFWGIYVLAFLVVFFIDGVDDDVY
jgi:hypothetical protein